MLFEVEHTTRFDYSEPVKLEPLTVRLRPRADRSQSLLYFEMDLDPAPAGLTEVSDLEGNDTALAWFTEGMTSLEIHTRLQAEALRTNPFDYLVLDPATMNLPMRYPKQDWGALHRYLQPSGDPEVSTLAWQVSRSAGGDAPQFLLQLCQRLAADVEAEIRIDGDPLPPWETLARGKGSCRDASVLFMDACRTVGLAARFVSGYQEGDPDVDEKYLHAWAEVYLQGVGWRGFDPSLGLAVADRHLALAAGPTAAAAAPTDGSFRGAARSVIKGSLDVRVAPPEGTQV